MSSINTHVLTLAEGWIGTPYRHQASTKGVGCDCLGLVRGIWRELYGQEPEVTPAYAPDWAERSGEDRLIEAAGRHFTLIASLGEALPGDLLVFRFRAHYAAKHLGLLAADQHFIHAYEQAAVVRSALVPAWRRRVAGVYRFPEK
ncbi:peptidase P60 [Agrobacterium vitis]|nr:NlpC/P60 family protein [Agrobacterium vitis]MCM2442807.1 peptidase P60 [Agrobacterium vitis]